MNVPVFKGGCDKSSQGRKHAGTIWSNRNTVESSPKVHIMRYSAILVLIIKAKRCGGVCTVVGLLRKERGCFSFNMFLLGLDYGCLQDWIGVCDFQPRQSLILFIPRLKLQLQHLCILLFIGHHGQSLLYMKVSIKEEVDTVDSCKKCKNWVKIRVV